MVEPAAKVGIGDEMNEEKTDMFVQKYKNMNGVIPLDAMKMSITDR